MVRHARTHPEAIDVAKASFQGYSDFSEGRLHSQHVRLALVGPPEVASCGMHVCKMPARGVPCSISRLNRILELEEEAFYESRAAAKQAHESSSVVDAVVRGAVQERLPRLEAGRSEGHGLYVLSGAEQACLLDREEEEYFATKAPRKPTTLMVRFIDYKLTADGVREHLRQLGFDGAYNFFYLPQFTRGSSNQGYFFLNFKDPADAAALKEQLQGEPLGSSAKRCDVTAAKWQGLKELRKEFDKKQVMKTKHRALFL